MEEFTTDEQQDFFEEQSSLLSFKMQRLIQMLNGSSNELKRSTVSQGLKQKTQSTGLSTYQSYEAVVQPLAIGAQQSTWQISTQQMEIGSVFPYGLRKSVRQRERNRTSFPFLPKAVRGNSPLKNSRFMVQRTKKPNSQLEDTLLRASGHPDRQGSIRSSGGENSSSRERQLQAVILSGKTSFKFIKQAKNDSRRHSQIFQFKVLSVGDIIGEGTVVLIDGTTMEGIWHEGSSQSSIKIRYPDKSCYQGDILNFKAHGFGTMISSRRDKYVGLFCQGEPHGEGRYFDSQGSMILQGEWNRGVFEG